MHACYGTINRFFGADKEKQIVRRIILSAIVHTTTNELRSQYITQKGLNQASVINAS